MNEEDEDENQSPIERQPIPEILHSFYEDRVFRTCTRCGESLPEFEEGFRISKTFKAGEVIFEYALCFPCMQAMMDESSEESKEALNKFHNERFRDVTGFDDCNLCERTRETARDEEFGLVGICQGDDMLDSGMVCVDCMEDMAEVISDETRGTWDKFKEENFPGVPADFKPTPIKDTPLVI